MERELRQNSQSATLGSDVIVAVFTLKGGTCPACPGHVLSIIRDVVELIGMDTARLSPAVWYNPLPDGLGGLGFTMVQPITTSFITWDAWPALGVAYLQVTSCKPFDAGLIDKFLSAHFRVVDRISYRMGSGGGI